MSNCFVIMPITTPEKWILRYSNDKQHFRHVLDCLFLPAIEKTGMTAVPPIAQGADVIQAEIIRNLETAELVLCDISTHNPNVFFELGCRTALNKPVCYVMDDQTENIPFDTGIINHHTYASALPAWNLAPEVDKLAEHIKRTLERGGDSNTLWRYFGLSSVARPAVGEGTPDDKLEYLMMEIRSLKKSIQDQPVAPNWRDGLKDFDLEENENNREEIALEVARSDLQSIERIYHKAPRKKQVSVLKELIQTHISTLEELSHGTKSRAYLIQASELIDRYRALLADKK